MSNLQHKAKQHLVPLIRDDWSHIGIAGRAVIGGWATMFTMVNEFADPQTLVTPQDQRDYLRVNRQPPASWCVWIGRYSGFLWNKASNHFLLAGPPAHPLKQGTQSQSTAFLLDKLFIMTASSNTEIRTIDAEKFSATYKLCTVWPVSEQHLSKPDSVLDDHEADRASRAFVPDELQHLVRHAWEVPQWPKNEKGNAS
jgi:hypothetical protein